jgi:hypothetical protein
MRQINATTETEAKAEAISFSLDNPGQYVTTVACFGLFLEAKPRLHANDPSDAAFPWYCLNGTAKPFTERQVIADQQATPALH